MRFPDLSSRPLVPLAVLLLLGCGTDQRVDDRASPDSAATKAAAASPAVDTNATRLLRWQLQPAPASATGEPNVTLLVVSEPTPVGGVAAPPGYLTARCTKAGTEVAFSGGMAFPTTPSGTQPVRIQLDDRPAESEEWRIVNAPAPALFAPDAVALLRRLVQASRIRIEYTAGGATRAHVFGTAGLAQLLPQIQVPCGWK